MHTSTVAHLTSYNRAISTALNLGIVILQVTYGNYRGLPKFTVHDLHIWGISTTEVALTGPL